MRSQFALRGEGSAVPKGAEVGRSPKKQELVSEDVAYAKEQVYSASYGGYG
jgi:hypothetical protein